jgi:myo-inositol-1(or 4)-monophosphatase
MTPSAVSPRDAAALTTLAVRAAEAAAAVIREAAPRWRDIVWQHKAAFDFVSEVDIGAERAAMAVFRAALPEVRFLAEETATGLSDAERDQGITVVLDPLDGTTNFLHGVPEYAVSVGVLVDGVPTSGVVLNVPRAQCYTATVGGGAWLGPQRLQVSGTTDVSRALIGTGFPFKDPADIPRYHAEMTAVMTATSGLRRPGAASIDLAWVAAGHFDGFWEPVLSPWDVAAGILLIHEAGGVCTDYEGQPSTASHAPIVAGNPTVQAWLRGALAEARARYEADRQRGA